MRRGIVTATGVLLAACAVPGALASGAAGAHVAKMARTMAVREEGRLHFLTSSGSEIIDEGAITGQIPGKAKVRFVYDGDPTVSASFTIYSSAGSISGHAKGKLSNPNSPSPSFRGSLTLTSGHGRYRHARGSGELFGVFYRRNYGLTFQAIGTLRY